MHIAYRDPIHLSRFEALSLLPDTVTIIGWNWTHGDSIIQSWILDPIALIEQFPTDNINFALTRTEGIGGGFVDVVKFWIDNHIYNTGYLQTDERKVEEWKKRNRPFAT